MLADSFLKILVGTPWWVWLALAYVLYRGVACMRDRVTPISRLFIMPAILVGLKYKIFADLNAQLMAAYLLPMALGIALGFRATRRAPLKIFKQAGSIELKGEYVTLLLLLVFFGAKYTFGYLQATEPNLPAWYALADNGLIGLVSGGFLGRSLCYLWRFISATSQQL